MKVAIIGLGFFGMNTALRFIEEGVEVLAVDNDENHIAEIQDKVSYVVQMDSTDERALRKLPLLDMDWVIVAIGEDFESSILTTALLQEIGIKNLVCRVTNKLHERLLKLMGITNIILPEAVAAGRLVNSMVLKGVLDSFELSAEHSIVEIRVPPRFIGLTIVEVDLRQRYHLNLVTIKRTETKRGVLSLGEKEVVRIMGVPRPDQKLLEDDIMVLFGLENDIKRLLQEGGVTT